ncbi:MAG: hypothetical protein V1682_03345 [Candidatus Omnitrophota bacterium]
MIRGLTVILILTLGILISSPCYPETVYRTEGRISGIDTFRSMVTVKALALSPVIAYTEFSLSVDPKTKITHKGDPADIFDLLMGSPVSAKFVDRNGTLDALEIAVTGGI